MKNVIIAVLVLAVGGLGYLTLTRDNTPQNTTAGTDSSTSEAAKPTVSGKTIDLSDQGLKEVPKSRLEDSGAVVLDVSNNRLTGALPAEIRKLSNLEELNASNNEMTGIPAEIGQLKKLKVVNFANNKLTGLPLEIGNLSQLVTLDLRGNPDISQYDIGQIQPKIPNATILTD